MLLNTLKSSEREFNETEKTQNLERHYHKKIANYLMILKCQCDLSE